MMMIDDRCLMIDYDDLDEDDDDDDICMYVFIDISMYVFIISFYRHIDYSI